MSLIFWAVLFTNKGSSFCTYTTTFIFLQGDGFSTRSDLWVIHHANDKKKFALHQWQGILNV